MAIIDIILAIATCAAISAPVPDMPTFEEAYPQEDTCVLVWYTPVEDEAQDSGEQVSCEQELYIPEWCGTEVHHGHATCGACGAELTEWRTVRDYADLEDVPNCPNCWAAFAEDTQEHRQQERDEFWNDPARVNYWTVDGHIREELATVYDED